MRLASLQAWRGWLTSRRLFVIHGWLGMKLSMLMVVIILTGAIATVSREIDWPLNPAIRIVPGETRVSWGTLYDRVQAAFPEAHVAALHAPIGARFAAEVLIYVGAERLPRRVYVNPYTGAVQGVTGWLNVQRLFRDLHRRLYMPWIGGLYLVSFFGFILLGSLITGVLVYKKWWRGFFRLRTDKGWRVFWGDTHRLVGLWSLWFLAIIATTGLWYFVQEAMAHTGRGLVIDSPSPTIDAATLARLGPTPTVLGVDRYVAIAQAALPGLDVKTIELPNAPSEPVYIDGQASAWLVRHYANHVLLDPVDGAVLHVKRAEDLSPAYRWLDTVDPLHFGNFGGLATKLLWAVSGVAVSGLTFTGSWLWLRRVHRLRNHASPSAEEDPLYG